MTKSQTHQALEMLRDRGFGGLGSRRLEGTITLRGALPATPEALAALEDAWNTAQLLGEQQR